MPSFTSRTAHNTRYASLRLNVHIRGMQGAPRTRYLQLNQCIAIGHRSPLLAPRLTAWRLCAGALPVPS